MTPPKMSLRELAAELKRLGAAADPGPWERSGECLERWVYSGRPDCRFEKAFAIYGEGGHSVEDAEFIQFMRNASGEIIEALERAAEAEEENEILRKRDCEANDACVQYEKRIVTLEAHLADFKVRLQAEQRCRSEDHARLCDAVEQRNGMESQLAAAQERIDAATHEAEHWALSCKRSINKVKKKYGFGSEKTLRFSTVRRRELDKWMSVLGCLAGEIAARRAEGADRE